MDNQTQRVELVNIMNTMDDCLDEIKQALDKLDFEQITKLVTVLTEAFIAVNQFVDSDYPEAAALAKEKIEYNRHLVNDALEAVLASYDSHDMEIRINSYEQLRKSMLIWTGHLFDTLQLHQ